MTQQQYRQLRRFFHAGTCEVIREQTGKPVIYTLFTQWDSSMPMSMRRDVWKLRQHPKKYTAFKRIMNETFLPIPKPL